MRLQPLLEKIIHFFPPLPVLFGRGFDPRTDMYFSFSACSITDVETFKRYTYTVDSPPRNQQIGPQWVTSLWEVSSPYASCLPTIPSKSTRLLAEWFTRQHFADACVVYGYFSLFSAPARSLVAIKLSNGRRSRRVRAGLDFHVYTQKILKKTETS
jgi:hypothetical protein